MGTLFVFSVLVFYCSLMIVPGLNLSNHQTREIHLRKLESCKGTRLPWRWTNIKIRFDKTTQRNCVSFKMVVDQKISMDLSVKVSFLKCDSSGNPDSCEYILEDREFENICPYLEMNDQPWNLLLDNIDKKLICPIEPGTYTVVDQPINSSVLVKVPIPDALWKIRGEAFDKGKKVTCVDWELQVVTLVN